MAKIGEDKYIFGMVKVGERGQIVIPLEARKIFDIKPGDLVLVAGDAKKGIAIAKVEGMKKYAMQLFGVLDSDKTDKDTDNQPAQSEKTKQR
jgi:AbrB family looped-hinge helix DNA binding protein